MCRQKCYYNNTMASKDILTHYLPWPEVHSTCNFHSFLGFHFCWSGSSGSSAFYTCPYPCKIHYSHTTSSPLLSPPTCLTLTSSSLHPRRPSPQYLPTFPSLPQSFPSQQWWESGGGIISTVFLGSSHTNSNCSQTHRSIGHCTCMFIISKPRTEAWGLQKPRFITTETLRPRWNAYSHSKQDTILSQCWLDS